MFFEVGNVSNVLLKSQQINNQYNTKELPYYIPFTRHREKSFSSKPIKRYK